MSRAQIPAQVFVYILTAVVIGVILIVGYRAISTVLNAANQAPIDSFKRDFSSKVEQMSRGYGSVSKFSFTLPERFEEVCFIDSMDSTTEKFQILPSVADNDFIKDVISGNVKYNVFLMKDEIIEEQFYVEDLDVSDDYLCIPNVGKLELWFEALGKTACLKKMQGGTC
jgi:hypothetical protein